ncbi:PACE efflux transporter [Amorphus coralli]|uniref:PACE efflux transporter n=1 Tax=Amorphus coralli TaxID=340680 RepID=UPI00036ABFE4|nr:PACE efflux transporter [Amorphus coralli]
MRTTRDRLRHVILFEVIGLALVTPLGAWVFGIPPVDMSAVTIVGSLIAMAWNYIYNVVFDTAMLCTRGTTRKTAPLRVLHAILFEGGLLLFVVPLISAFLGITLWVALMMDVAFASFYLVYALVFNWLYDMVFPIREERSSRAES